MLCFDKILIVKRIKHLLYLPFKWMYLSRLKKNLFKHKDQAMVVFDIDNTLAATAPILRTTGQSESFYKSLPVIYKMNDLIKSYEEKGYHVFFLTARRYKYEEATFYWLKSNAWVKYKYQLLIVRFAEDKMAFLDKMKNHSKVKIDYWDDLTYNHENEELKFYQKVIEEVKQKDWIQYFGYKEIEKETKCINI